MLGRVIRKISNAIKVGTLKIKVTTVQLITAIARSQGERIMSGFVRMEVMARFPSIAKNHATANVRKPKRPRDALGKNAGLARKPTAMNPAQAAKRNRMPEPSV